MTTLYRLERAEQVGRDLQLIFRFLVRSHRQFGETFGDAKARAAAKVALIEAAMERLVAKPHQGTLLPKLGSDLRSVTKDRAVFYFVTDDEAHVVRVLAVFFGGQDHQREMLKRLRGA